jgi:hypothetical protein
MKNTYYFLKIGLCFLLFGCKEYKETRTSGTVDTVNIGLQDSLQMAVSDRKDLFLKAYNDIIQAIKKEEYDKIDLYIDSSKGYFLITRPKGQPFYSFQHGDHFGDLSGGEGPEAEAADNFFSNIRQANGEMIKISDLGKEDSTICEFKKEGVYKIHLRKVRPVYSQDYKTNKEGVKITDDELLQALTEMEGSFTSKLYMNKLNINMKNGHIIYFSESDGKVYLSALDLSNCQ